MDKPFRMERGTPTLIGYASHKDRGICLLARSRMVSVESSVEKSTRTRDKDSRGSRGSLRVVSNRYEIYSLSDAVISATCWL